MTRFSFRLVIGYGHVFILVFVVIVSLSLPVRTQKQRWKCIVQLCLMKIFT